MLLFSVTNHGLLEQEVQDVEARAHLGFPENPKEVVADTHRGVPRVAQLVDRALRRLRRCSVHLCAFLAGRSGSVA